MSVPGSPPAEAGIEPQPLPDARSEGVIGRIFPVAAVLAVVIAAGLVIVALADNLARDGGSGRRILFWVGLLVIVLPPAAALLARDLSRRQRLAIITLLAIGLYLVKVLASPLGPTFHDELGHWRTLDDIVHTGHLYSHNPILRASPFYPGLEIVTTAVAKLSGLSLFASALIVVGIARVIAAAALYGIYAVAGGSDRVAALATVVYMTNPTFLFFDGQFSYESLAVALAPAALLALARFPARAAIPTAAIIGAGVVVTHHLTTYALCGILVLWTLAALVLPRRRTEPAASALAVVTAAVIAMAVAWAVFVAPVTTSYLWPVLRNAGSAVASLAHGENAAKHPFQGSGGYGRPAWEQYASFASVMLVMISLPVGVVLALRRRATLGSLAVTLILIGLAYPVALLPRLTQAGTEVANRSSGFVFLGVGFLAAIVLTAAVPAPRSGAPHPGFRTRLAAGLAVIGVLMVGGIDIGWPPYALQPGPYLPAANSRSVDVQARWAAQWARTHLPRDQRTFGDFDLQLLMAAYGRQDPQGGFISGTPLPRLFTSPKFDAADRRILVADQLRYLVVDRRLSGALPASGYYFAPSEPGAFDHARPIPRQALAKFSDATALDEIFRGGGISIYHTALILRRAG